MVLAGQSLLTLDRGRFIEQLETAAEYLESSRPTAVNLSWAVRRVLGLARACQGGDVRDIVADMLIEAKAIHAEDAQLCQAIGRESGPIIQRHRGVLTHCNAGALATGGIGTATAGMYLAHAAGHDFRVYCDETRPLLQGARLTAWELLQGGLEAIVITDSTAGPVLKEGRAGMVLVGADRIAANGDAANKIGTYPLAVLARRHSVPFYVAAPYSTFDMSIASGEDIPIEQRACQEITEGFGQRTAPAGVETYSPAFDVTPAELITGIITGQGIIQPVTPENIRVWHGHLAANA
jgi:methylthioribose-1-phosphate isomerase